MPMSVFSCFSSACKLLMRALRSMYCRVISCPDMLSDFTFPRASICERSDWKADCGTFIVMLVCLLFELVIHVLEDSM